MTKLINIIHFTEHMDHTSHLYYTVLVLSKFLTTFLLHIDTINSTENGGFL